MQPDVGHAMVADGAPTLTRTARTPARKDTSMPENPLERAPKLAEINTEVLFGDIWERPELSKRDRSLITVASLVSLYRTEQLGFHLGRAIENGVTREELVEAITHLAFYSGWPTAVSALARLDDVLRDLEASTPDDTDSSTGTEEPGR